MTQASSTRSAETLGESGPAGEILMLPGPVSLTREVQSELARPVRPHYGSSWVEAFNDTAEKLAGVFQSHGEIIVFFGPGSAAIESGLRSCLERNKDRLLVPVNGMFGERLALIAELNGIAVTRLEGDPGQSFSAEEVVAAADAARATAVALVYTETGSGLRNPVGEICTDAAQAGLFTVVDAVSAFAGVELDVDAWKVDVCVGVSNKCLAAPVGLSPISLSNEAVERCSRQRSEAPGWYFNLATWRQYAAEMADWHPHPTTMPTGALYAVQVATKVVLADMPAYIDRHSRASASVRGRLREWGFRLHIGDDCAAPVVTTAHPHPEMNLDHYIAWLAQRHGLRVGRGLGDHSDLLRIGHMGRAADNDVVDRYLDATHEYLDMYALL